MSRFYIRPAVDDPNSHNVYDRNTPCPSNSTGHACVSVGLTYDQARATQDRLNSTPHATPLDVVRALLLFHGSNPWDADKRAAWKALTGSDDATTVTLCEFARRVLDQAEGRGL
jgi:hypothetical protein